MLHDLTKLEKFSKTDRFREAAIFKETTGRYCPYPEGTLDNIEWWDEEERRCREGFTIDGITVTGRHYFFLNYHELDVSPTGNIAAAIKKGTYRKKIGLPKFWAIHWDIFHAWDKAISDGKDLCILKPRRAGLSEIAGSNGCYNYTFFPASTTIYMAYLSMHLDAVWDKFWGSCEYLNKYTEFGKITQQTSKKNVFRQASYIDNVTKQEFGSMSKAMGIVANTTDKVRGYTANEIYIEEGGSFPNLLPTMSALAPVVKENGVRVGNILLFGTGGNDGPGIEGLTEIVLKPNEWDFLETDGIFDGKEYNRISYFFPAHYVRRDFIDEDGNTDFESADIRIREERDKIKSPRKRTKDAAESPIKPEEALISISGNVFNQAALEEQISNVLRWDDKMNPHLKPKKGRLEWVKDTNDIVVGVKWFDDDNGKIEIVEHPARMQDDMGNLMEGSFNNLYIAGLDSIDMGLDDQSENTNNPSQLALLVKKRQFTTTQFSNMYVCMYKDRPHDIHEAYDNVLKIAWYFNCKINLEYTRKEIISYFRSKNQLHWFIKRPSIFLNDVKSETKLIGTQATQETNKYMDKLVDKYINENYQKIFFFTQLRDLKGYNANFRTKYDLVVAMGMCEVADEDMFQKIPEHSVSSNVKLELMPKWYVDKRTGFRKFGIPEEELNKIRQQEIATKFTDMTYSNIEWKEGISVNYDNKYKSKFR